MKFTATLLLLLGSSYSWAEELRNIHVLVVTDAPEHGRGEDFADWLRPLVASVSIMHYHTNDILNTSDLKADVILFDWDQTSFINSLLKNREGSEDPGAAMALIPAPFGTRTSWRTPMVLLGSAGLLLSHSWKVAGDRGCTCLQPFAFHLNTEHPVEQGPLKLDLSHYRQVLCPATAFPTQVESRIQVLPLVDGDPGDRWAKGWCVYTEPLSSMPDIECISGGINEKSPTAVAIWRQGNLLHFGFQQSPKEMNNDGRALLANSIAYIADFHQDQPIAQNELGDDGHRYLSPRGQLQHWLLRYKEKAAFPSFAMSMLSASEQSVLSPLSVDAVGFEVWCKERLPYLHPDANYQTLSVDEELQSFAVTYDSAKFLDLSINLLHANPDLARTLIKRYIPECPDRPQSLEEIQWLTANRQYLFPTDTGGYRWYVDSLARDRGVPSITLRGPSRKDVPLDRHSPAGGLSQSTR